MNTLEEVRTHLKEGSVYRRRDLLAWSKSVDRHLQQLVKDGTLRKLKGGLYYRPQKMAFGERPAETEALVSKFLKDDHFLVTSFNAFNALGLGTTQLYNHRVVYNRKRHGVFDLGGQRFEFRLRFGFPDKPSPEFYVVDMLNNLERLAEDQSKVLEVLRRKLSEFNTARLNRVLKDFGTVRARRLVGELRSDQSAVA